MSEVWEGELYPYQSTGGSTDRRWYGHGVAGLRAKSRGEAGDGAARATGGRAGKREYTLSAPRGRGETTARWI